MKSLFVAAGLAVATAAWAAPVASVQTRDVPINQILQGRLPQPIDLNVPVPADYVQSGVKRIGYSYWMRPADAATASAEKLPTRNGYLVASLATKVTYDARHKVFYGIDDPGSLAKMKSVATNVQVRQLKEGKHPAVLVSMTSATTGQPAYFMYMATGVKNDTFFLSFQPPEGRRDIGDAVWAKLAANIK
jgi:hypothetical protein